LPKAKTIEGLRKLQAVVLPLEFGLSLEQTAKATGVSVGWISQLRNRWTGVLMMRDRKEAGDIVKT